MRQRERRREKCRGGLHRAVPLSVISVGLVTASAARASTAALARTHALTRTHALAPTHAPGRLVGQDNPFAPGALAHLLMVLGADLLTLLLASG